MSTDGQSMLSTWGGGDTDNLDLTIPEEGYDLQAHREVKAYAAEACDGTGWEVVGVSNDRVSWWGPDGSATYWIERSDSGWTGSRRFKTVKPTNEPDLQTAIDVAGEFMVERPLNDSEADQ